MTIYLVSWEQKRGSAWKESAIEIDASCAEDAIQKLHDGRPTIAMRNIQAHSYTEMIAESAAALGISDMAVLSGLEQIRSAYAPDEREP